MAVKGTLVKDFNTVPEVVYPESLSESIEYKETNVKDMLDSLLLKTSQIEQYLNSQDSDPIIISDPLNDSEVQNNKTYMVNIETDRKTKHVLLKKKFGNKVYDIYPRTDASIVQYKDTRTVEEVLDAHTRLISEAATSTDMQNELNKKVDKVAGKGLSTNDFTNTLKSKLDNIQSGAEVNVQSDWDVTDTGSDAFIKHKPTHLPANGGNSATVNGHTVQSDVPPNAKFTDTVYVHPSNDGNKHVPANGTTNSGKFLRATATAGTYRWEGLSNTDITSALGYDPLDIPVTYQLQKVGNKIYLNCSDGSSTFVTDDNATYGLAATAANGLMSSTDKSKLNNIEANANNYTHPTYTQRTPSFGKVAVDGYGHVSNVTPVTKSDITDLGIPEENTWRGIQNNLTSNSTTESLSAYQGKILNDSKFPHKNIPTATNFNNFTSPGFYYINATASNINAPCSLLGLLLVYPNGSNIVQIYIPSTGAIWYFRRYSGAWTNWSNLRLTDTVYSHPASGVSAGTYRSVTVNSQGHVTAGSNPTTLAGYGITDAESKGSASNALEAAKVYTNQKIADLVNGADPSLDTLGELATAVVGNRTNISALKTRLDALANSDDTTLDQMAEVVAYIKNNKSLIDGITTSKVSVSDIVNNLTSTATNKPLSANQGKVLKDAIDTLNTNLTNHKNDDGRHNKVTQQNTTASADNRLLLSQNANDTSEAAAAKKSNQFLANPSTGELYAKGYRRIDITGQTLDINTLTLNAGAPTIMRYIEKTDAGASKITNIPVAGHPFILDVELIRWTSTSDYITKQTFRNASDYGHDYVRICTNGTWTAWQKRIFTDTTYTTGTASKSGLTKLYTGLGTATDGTLTQAALNTQFGKYLPLTGGTLTGRLMEKLGSIVHYASAGSGTAGYIKFGTIKITTTYKNSPIVIELTKRVGSLTSTLYLSFSSENNANPSTAYFNYTGADYECYVHHSAASTWDLYVRKAEAYDSICVLRYHKSPQMDGVNITWTDTLATSVPSGSVRAILAGQVLEARRLETARKINGVAFNGTADITISASPTANSLNYVRVVNSSNVGSSNTMTVNDLAKKHAAVAMINPATDNPTGAAKWVSVWNYSWQDNNNSSWVSQIALGTQNGNGMWYRARQGAITGAAWNRVLDSSNYTGYTVTKTGSGASGTWGINITGNAATVSVSRLASNTAYHYNIPLVDMEGEPAHVGLYVQQLTFQPGLGTTATVGDQILCIGNSIPKGTDKNARGILQLYNQKKGYTNFVCTEDDTSHTITFPNKNGTVALTSHTHNYAGERDDSNNGEIFNDLVKNKATGQYSHAEGGETTAAGKYSHAEGYRAKANGLCSHAGGYYTNADSVQMTIGKFNKSVTGGGTTNNNSGSAFIIGNGQSGYNSNAFRVEYYGNVYGKSFNTSGADYAEYLYEWYDGNEFEEDRVGYFVTFKDKKLYKATSNDYIVGIISGNPSVVGSADEDYYWRYERDEFNRIIMEDVPEIIENVDETGKVTKINTGNTIKNGMFKTNKNYNPSLPYVERKNRKEWDYVGMLGVLPLRDDGTCIPGQFCRCNDSGIATFAKDTNGQIFMVLERVNDHVIKVLLK